MKDSGRTCDSTAFYSSNFTLKHQRSGSLLEIAKVHVEISFIHIH